MDLEGDHRDYDQDVSNYIKEAGGIVNRSIVVVAAAKGILSHKNSGLLKEHGGSICLSSTWAETFLHRIGYVKHKATKAARKLPDDFPEVKQAFLQRVKSDNTVIQRTRKHQNAQGTRQPRGHCPSYIIEKSL